MSGALGAGGSAFPRVDMHPGREGMSLRDYFAARAMQGLIGAHQAELRARIGADVQILLEHIATEAYRIADGMIWARGLPK
jgi:hypothetical protein